MVDVDDLPLVNLFTWGIDLGSGLRTPYATTSVGGANGRKTHVSAHRLLLDAPRGTHVDHRDGNGLNNVRSNIRVATPSQNRANEIVHRQSSSKYKGVSLRSGSADVWIAQAIVGGVFTHLGSYDRQIDAALAYDDAMRSEFGEFAATNFTLEEAARIERQPRRQKQPVGHGVTKYQSYKCRCDVCVMAYRKYMNLIYHRRMAERRPDIAAKKRVREERNRDIYEMFKSGQTIDQITTAIGTPRTTIRGVLVAAGVEFPKRKQKKGC